MDDKSTSQKYTSQYTSQYTSLVSARAAFVTLMVMQIIIGYEWLMSGVTKVASGTFVSGLGANLKMSNPGEPHWYMNFLNSTIIPHAHAFALGIEIGEFFVGIAFIVAAFLWVTRWKRLPD